MNVRATRNISTMLPDISADDVMTGLTIAQRATGVVDGIKKLFPKGAGDEKVSALISELLAIKMTSLEIHAEHEKARRIIGELNAEIVARDKWDQEASRYELKEVAPSLTVYSLRPEHEGAEPPHWLCTGCHAKRQKGIFTLVSQAGKTDKEFRCPLCGFTVKTFRGPGSKP